jgi:hypothetical protein
MPHMANNHIQNNLHNALQDETSFQLHQVGQNDPQVEAVVNMNRINGKNNNEADIVRHNIRRNDGNKNT